MKVVIVGGVAGGASAAARLRRLDEQAHIVIYERSGYISYANCGLPYYVGGVIEDKAELTLQTPQSFFERFAIEANVNHEVVSINPAAKTLVVRKLLTGETFEDSYDKLVLSPGAKALRPGIPGEDLENVFFLRTVEDTFKLTEYLENSQAKSALVVGGGFVGLEAAENFKERGMQVTIVQSPAQMLSVLDKDMATQIHAVLRKNEIDYYLETRVLALEQQDGTTICKLSNGQSLTADVVLFAIGVTPDTELAKQAGLRTGIKGSIVVDETMLTSNPDIYAVGDAVEVVEHVSKTKSLISLAGPANKQGRIAADNIAGGHSIYKGSQGSLVIKLFDLTAAATGINEKQAQAQGINYDKVILFPSSHATYYPGGKTMSMKVLFERESNRLLGAQIVGYEGVDKRIDVIATALRAGLKATELAELELAYAPPYASAKDPVNMAGFIIENLASGKLTQCHYEELERIMQEGNTVLLDVRTPAEYARGHAQGFINIPLDELRDRLDEVPTGKSICVMCQSGARSYIATRLLIEHGFDAHNFAGGYRYYSMLEEEQLASTASFACGMEK